MQSIRLLDHALAILEAFETATDDLGATEVSRRLALPLSTAHRLLTALRVRGYLDQDPRTRRYRLGLKAVLLGTRALVGMEVRDVAHPILEQLVSTTGETAHLAVLQETEVLYLDKVSSPQPVQVHTMIGTRAPAVLTATGKAILAYRDPEEAERALAGLVSSDHRAEFGRVPALGELHAELERIRCAGMSVSHGQWYPGVTSVAAPVFDQARAVVAAVGTATPNTRFDLAKQSLLGREVARAAGEISVRMGFLP